MLIYIYIFVYVHGTQEGVDFPRLQNEETCTAMMNATGSPVSWPRPGGKRICLRQHVRINVRTCPNEILKKYIDLNTYI